MFDFDSDRTLLYGRLLRRFTQTVSEIPPRRSAGFTIIEVMIVLAIAALIMVVVLIAVPQLQRNQRNDARRDMLARISAEVTSFAGNNKGDLPVASTANTNGYFGSSVSDSNRTFFKNYLSGVNIEDPSTGNNITVRSARNYPTNSYLVANYPAAAGQIGYYTRAYCDPNNNESVTRSGAVAANFALVTWLEGGARYCIDNR